MRTLHFADEETKAQTEVQSLVQSHLASNWQSQDKNYFPDSSPGVCPLSHLMRTMLSFHYSKPWTFPALWPANMYRLLATQNLLVTNQGQKGFQYLPHPLSPVTLKHKRVYPWLPLASPPTLGFYPDSLQCWGWAGPPRMRNAAQRRMQNESSADTRGEGEKPWTPA